MSINYDVKSMKKIFSTDKRRLTQILKIKITVFLVAL